MDFKQTRSNQSNMKNAIRFLSLLFLFCIISSSSTFAITLASKNFDDGSVTSNGWTTIIHSGSYNWSAVTSGSYPTTSPYSPSYMGTFQSFNASSGYNASLISPVMDFSLYNITVYFYMVRDAGYSSNADKLEVYASTSTSYSSGTLLGTINRSTSLSPSGASTGWNSYSITVPRASFKGKTNYIIFRAVSAYGNNMYFDNLLIDAQPIPPDAGISALLSPKSPFSVGIQNVSATLKNFGEVTLTSCRVDWTVNGVAQPSYNWTGSLTQNSTANISLGAYDFSYPPAGPFNPFTITVTASNPNGGSADNDNSNNTLNASVAPILNDAGPVGISGPPQGFTPGLAQVFVKVKNYAPKPLTSITLDVSVEGVKLPPATVSGLNIASGQVGTVLAGTYSFTQARMYSITANTSKPNGIDDEVQTNDSYTGGMGPSISPGNYTVGTGGSYATLNDAISYLSASGIIGNGDVYFMLKPGTYTGQINLSTFPRSTNRVFFQSTSGNASDVIIQATPNAANNYVFKLDGVSDIYFKNITIKNANNNASSAGTCLWGLNSDRIYFEKVVFWGVSASAQTDFYNLVYLNNIPNYSFDGCNFIGGSKGLYDVTSNCVRNVDIKNNMFQGQTWFGAYLQNNYQACSNRANNMMVHDNFFMSDGVTNPPAGLYSINAATMIYNNTFTGMKGRNVTDAAVYIANSPQNAEMVSIHDNKMTNSNNTGGIYVNMVANGEILNNTITFSGTNANSGIGIMGSGPGSNTMMVKNNTVNVNGSYGLMLSNCSADVMHNTFNSTSSVIYGVAAFQAQNYRGYVAHNMFIGNNADGMYFNNTAGAEVYYNSVQVGTANNTAVYYNYSGGAQSVNDKQAQDNTQSGLTAGAKLMRNLFLNVAGGYAVNGNYTNLISDENNWYTSGKNMHPTYATLAAWQTATNLDRNSTSQAVVFKSATDLHLAQINEFIYKTYPVFSKNDPLFSYIESQDWDGENRVKVFYYGVDHIQPLVNIYQQPESQVVCSNGSVRPSFSVLASVSFGAVPYYQWQKDGVDLPGKTTAQFTIELSDLSFDKSGSYRCRIWGSGGAEEVISEEVLLYVLTPPEITRNPESVIGQQGGTAMFEVKAHVYNWGEPIERLQYQWYAGDINNPLQDDNHIAGSKSSILSITKIRPQDFRNDYFVVVTDQCGTATSAFCGILVPPDVNITGQPQDASICEGQNANFGVTAEIIGGGKVLSYEWWKDGVKLEDNANISGAMTANLTIATIGTGDAGKYKCKVTVMPGAVSKETNEAELVVKLKPTITTQPEATVDVQTGRNFSLTVAADGTAPLYYQWYKDDQELAGETNPAYSVPSATLSDAGTYKCKVSNDCGEIFTNNTVVNVTMENSTDVPELSYNGFTLYTNTPNPFAEQTTITFAVPRASEVRLTVNDIFGREVSVLFEGTATGRTDVRFDASKLASGIYYYTMTTNGFNGTKQMVIVK